MRKTFYLLACLLLCISFGTTLCAENETTQSDVNNIGTSSPLAGWTFGIFGGWDENAPKIPMPTYARNMKYDKLCNATTR